MVKRDSLSTLLRVTGLLALAALAPPALAQNIQDFSIAIGDTVADGVPGPGAGNIENPNDLDVYRFSASAGEVVFFETLQNGIAGLPLTLVGPSEEELFVDNLIVNIGRVELPESGEYTLTVGSATVQNVGTYSFRIVAVPEPTVFPIGFGQVVADGSPAPGAGRIETPGSSDVYTFEGQAGQTIFIQAIEGNLGGVAVQLDGPVSEALIISNFIVDIGRFELPETGTYTLTVGDAVRDNVGPYSFAIFIVPEPTVFPIGFDEIVADGSPGPGAGRIETPGSIDVYTFEGVAGQTIFIHAIESSIVGVAVQLDGPTSDALITSNFIVDIGRFELPESGTYTLTVGDVRRDNVGPYSFQVVAVPEPTVFPIAIGATVSDGSPAAGAGNIERPGFIDIYRFEASPGQRVFLDVLSSEIVGVAVQLRDSEDEVVLTDNFIVNPGLIELDLGGTYDLIVGDARRDNVGTYSFRLLNVPQPDEFAILLNDVVRTGVPGTGAGNIETPGASDIYRFEGRAGQRIDIDRLETGFFGVAMRIFAPDGSRVLALSSIVDRADIVLPQEGIYRLVIGDTVRDDTGLYSLVLRGEPFGGDVPLPDGLAAGDALGAAVAVDDNLLVIGAPEDADGGTVYVYRFEGEEPVFEQAIPVPEGFTAENFGASLALEDGTLVIGAPQGEASAKGGILNNMRAAIYQRVAGCAAASATCWELKGPVNPLTSNPADGFGSAVALTGGTIVVGAPNDADGEGPVGSGAAFSFAFDGNTVNQTGISKPFFGQPGAGFGTAAAATGGRVAIGAPGAQLAGGVAAGAASLFGLVGSNLGAPQTVGAPGNDPGAGFGRSMAIDGESMVVGAPGASGGAGLAALYGFGGGNLVQTAVLAPTAGTENDGFGSAVGVAAGRVVIGAPAGSGALYRFGNEGAGIVQTGTTVGDPGTGLGTSLAISGGRLASGAPQADGARGATRFQLLDDTFFATSFE